MKKSYFALIAGGLAIAVVVIGGSRLRAQVGSTGSSGIPISSLAGNFAGEGVANYGICLNNNFTAVQSCSRTPLAQIVPFVENSTSQGTGDTSGHSCNVVVDTSAPLFPGPEPAGVNRYIVVGTTTSYNPATGSGNISYKLYFARPDVTCRGATFVNTANARVIFTSTSHFVVSENGTRLDAITLTFHTVSPVDFVAGFVQHSFALRQTH